MKVKSFFKVLLIFSSVILLHSCSKSLYYQVYDVKSDDLHCSKEKIVYSNDECDIIYNFWDNAGNMGFFFRNYTDTDIYIDLTRSFFIRNDIAYDYYSDSEQTHSVTEMAGSNLALDKSYTHFGFMLPKWTPTAVTRGVQVVEKSMVGTSRSVSTREMKYICVPANSAKYITSFNISDYVYLDCDNNRQNMPKRVSESITYSRKSSPLVFRNRIVYYIGESEEGIVVDNSFWVSGFVNYSQKEFAIEEYETDCVDKSVYKKVQIHKYKSADRFYNEYKFNREDSPNHWN